MTDRAWRARVGVLRLRRLGLSLSAIAARLRLSRRHVARILADARKEAESRQEAG